MNTSLRTVETKYLAIRNHFYIFVDTCASESFFFVKWKCIFDRIFHFNYCKKISALVETIYFTWEFFLLVETVTDMSGNQFFKHRTNSCLWKLIFWLVEIILFHCARSLSRSPSSRLVGTHCSVQKKKYCFFIQNFLFCWWKPI